MLWYNRDKHIVHIYFTFTQWNDYDIGEHVYIESNQQFTENQNTNTCTYIFANIENKPVINLIMKNTKYIRSFDSIYIVKSS